MEPAVFSAYSCPVHHANAVASGLRLARRIAVAVGVGAVFVGAPLGCETGEKRRAMAAARPLVQRDVAPLLRGTIGAEGTLQGAESVLVTGYGIVVGLTGTGAGDAPPAVRAYLEREMTLRGVGSESSGMGNVSPRQMLDDPNNCVVLVSAVVSPCTPKAELFDVMVSTLPGSAATSLEGGRLWTTDLRIGVMLPGAPTARVIGKARGPVFINPFLEPGTTSGTTVATTGRIIGGGQMTAPLELFLSLDNPSHTRARAMASAINARFPQQTGDTAPIARGKNEDVVALAIPHRWRADPDEFVQLIAHTRIDQAFPQDWAQKFVQGLKDEPWLATELSWCLQAIGPGATPALRSAYEFGEIVPRLAALRAGARLGDALVTPHLTEIARAGPPAQRLSAIELLGDLPSDPKVNLALRELLDSPDTTVRIAAYEALVRRRDPALERVPVAGKFILDIVPSKDPMIYISQQGEPRVAVFGPEGAVEVSRPTLVSAWSNRLLVASDSPSEPLRVMYTDTRAGKVTRADRVDPRLSKLIPFLAHEPTPEAPAPGLAMSYSQVVGALYELTIRQRAIDAGFMAEGDRLQAQVLASAQSTLNTPRPELAGETPDEALSRLQAEQAAEAAARGSGERPDAPAMPAKPTYVVPIPPKTTGGEDKGEPR